MDTAQLRSQYEAPHTYPHLFDDIWDRIRDYYATHGTQYHHSGVQSPYHESILALSYAWQQFQKQENDRMVAAQKQIAIEKERNKVGYPTKRYCPQGYVAVTKPLARKLYELGYSVTFCGNNVNAYHVFNGWHLGCTMNISERDGTYNPYTKETIPDDFQDVVNNFLSYLDKELGTYCVYYVKQSDYEISTTQKE